MIPPNDRRVAFACLLAGIAFFLAWEWFGVPYKLRYRASASIGFGATLLILTLLVLLVAIIRSSGRVVPRRVWWLALPIALLALDLTWYANKVVLVLAPVGAIVLLLALGARAAGDTSGQSGSLIPLRIVWDVVRAILGIARLPGLLVVREQGRWKAVIRDIVVGSVIALPFLAIFALLFAEANDAFSAFLRSVLTEEAWRWISRHIPHAIVALGISGYLAALLLAPRAERKIGGGVRSEISPRIAVSFFVLLDALFLLFVVLQGLEFFGGEAWLRAHGLTYAFHARRGFFELVVAAGFAGFLALAWYRTIRRGEDGSAIRAAMGAILVFLALTFLVAVSSIERLWTYGSVYGLTLLRVYATTIVVTIMAGLGILANHLVRAVAFNRVMRHVSVLAVVVFTIIMTLPVERVVAEWNASPRTRGQSTVPFDARYIALMSPDAWPALFRAATRDARVAEVVRELGCPVMGRNRGSGRGSSYYSEWRRSPYWQSYHFAHRVCDRLPEVQSMLQTVGRSP